MINWNESRRIVRTYEQMDAPTGEGARYVDEYGTVWKPQMYPGDAATGEIQGTKHGDRIKVKQEAQQR